MIMKYKEYLFSDFTRDNYRNLLLIAKSKYKFCNFRNFANERRFIIWRHDVDFSVHSAAKLALIEYEERIQSTYFVWLHSNFYNLLENNVKKCVFEILELGHDLGLHFDISFYDIKNDCDLEKYLLFEKEILESIFCTEISSFSFHLTDKYTLSKEELTYANLTNVYSSYFKNEVGYCSDSNGYWRYRRLQDVLESAEDEKLQVLTHPCWWTPEPMSPRDRISRCIDGRAARQHQQYDKLLEQHGRENIR